MKYRALLPFVVGAALSLGTRAEARQFVAQETYLKASNSTQSDWFGSALAMAPSNLTDAVSVVFN